MSEISLNELKPYFEAYSRMQNNTFYYMMGCYDMMTDEEMQEGMSHAQGFSNPIQVLQMMTEVQRWQCEERVKMYRQIRTAEC